MTVVLDASAAFPACLVEHGFAAIAAHGPTAPALMWSEVRSSLRQAAWRGDLERDHAFESLGRLEAAAVEPNLHPALGRDAWLLAEQLGWAKTYDAEYVALAQLLGCRLVTVDERLRRGADRVVEVVAPADL